MKLQKINEDTKVLDKEHGRTLGIQKDKSNRSNRSFNFRRELRDTKVSEGQKQQKFLNSEGMF